jgi:hypothetical protein
MARIIADRVASARVHDTHANLWSSLDVRPPTGACQIPIALRLIENQAVVTRASDAAAAAAGSRLQRGDVVTAIEGTDGSVSSIPLPGGLRSMISGIAVFYPDKKPTQRVGIIP